MKGRISDRARILHILDCIEKIENATNGHTFDSFFENELIQAAVERWLEIIGEAAKNVSESTKNDYNIIEWRKMAGMRNAIIHEYFEVDYQAIWKAIIILKEWKPIIATISATVK